MKSLQLMFLSLIAAQAPSAFAATSGTTDVRVVSSPSAPVHTHEVPGSTVYANGTGNLSADGVGVSSTSQLTTLTVPAGRHLVLEHASVKCVSQGGQLIYPLLAIKRNEQFFASFPLNPLKAASQTVAVGSESPVITASADDTVALFAARESSIAAGFCFGNLAGRLY